jgi:hypothetical protein
MTSHWGFNLSFSDDTEQFSHTCCHFHLFFWGISTQTICLFCIVVFLSSLLPYGDRANASSCSVGHVFTLTTMSFAVEKLLVWHNAFVCFALLVCSLGILSKKIFACLDYRCLEGLPPVVAVSSLKFKSLIHIKWLFFPPFFPSFLPFSFFKC